MGFISREELELKALRQPLDRKGFISREELRLRELKKPLVDREVIYKPNYNL